MNKAVGRCLECIMMSVAVAPAAEAEAIEILTQGWTEGIGLREDGRAMLFRRADGSASVVVAATFPVLSARNSTTRCRVHSEPVARQSKFVYRTISIA